MVAPCRCPCHQNAEPEARGLGQRFEGHPEPSPGVPVATVELGPVGAAPARYCTHCAAAWMLWLLGEEKRKAVRYSVSAAVEELIEATRKGGGA